MPRIAMALALAGTLALTACQTTQQPPAEAKLTGDALRNVVSGNTFDARNTARQSWYEYHQPDGTLFAGSGKSGNHSWRKVGEWWVEDDAYCLTMPGWNNATNRCQPIYETDEGYQAFWQDGRLYMRFQVLEGDPQDLAEPTS